MTTTLALNHRHVCPVCLTATHTTIPVDQPRHDDLRQLAVTCHNCLHVHWFTIRLHLIATGVWLYRHTNPEPA